MNMNESMVDHCSVASAPRLAEQAISGGCEQLESCRQQPAASSRIWGTEMLHAR